MAWGEAMVAAMQLRWCCRGGVPAAVLVGEGVGARPRGRAWRRAGMGEADWRLGTETRGRLRVNSDRVYMDISGWCDCERRARRESVLLACSVQIHFRPTLCTRRLPPPLHAVGGYPCRNPTRSRGKPSEYGGCTPPHHPQHIPPEKAGGSVPANHTPFPPPPPPPRRSLTDPPPAAPRPGPTQPPAGARTPQISPATRRT